MSRVLLSCLGLGAAAALTLTGGSVAGAFAGGLGGNLATDFYKILHRSVAERFLDGWSGIDENHHVNRALRLAQIDGLRAILKRFDTGMASDRDQARHREAERFTGVMKEFLDRETKVAQALAFGSGVGVSADEQAIRLRVLQTLPDAFDQGLAMRRAGGDESAMHESLRQLRVAVETAVLEEIRLQSLAKGEDFPPLFCSLFEGRGQTDGWFDLFIRDAAGKIKEGTDFAEIWNAEQTALIKAIVTANAVTLDRIDRRTEALSQGQMAMLTDQAEQNSKLDAILATIRAEKGVPIEALRQILRGFGESGASLEPSQIEQRLRAKADEYRVLQERLSRYSPDDPRVQELRGRASAFIYGGRLDLADIPLAEAEARDLAAVEQMEDVAHRRRISAAVSRSERGAAARLQSDYSTAASHFAEAAQITPSDEFELRWYYLLEQARSKSDNSIPDPYWNEMAFRLTNSVVEYVVRYFSESSTIATVVEILRDEAGTKKSLQALRDIGDGGHDHTIRGNWASFFLATPYREFESIRLTACQMTSFARNPLLDRRLLDARFRFVPPANPRDD